MYIFIHFFLIECLSIYSQVRNRGWEFRELSDDEMSSAEERDAIRGFVLHKHETRRIVAKAGEVIVVDEGGGVT